MPMLFKNPLTGEGKDSLHWAVKYDYQSRSAFVGYYGLWIDRDPERIFMPREDRLRRSRERRKKRTRRKLVDPVSKLEMTDPEWADYLGIPVSTFTNRICRNGPDDPKNFLKGSRAKKQSNSNW